MVYWPLTRRHFYPFNQKWKRFSQKKGKKINPKRYLTGFPPKPGAITIVISYLTDFLSTEDGRRTGHIRKAWPWASISNPHQCFDTSTRQSWFFSNLFFLINVRDYFSFSESKSGTTCPELIGTGGHHCTHPYASYQ